MDIDVVVFAVAAILDRAEAKWGKRKALSAEEVLKRWHWYGLETIPDEKPELAEVQAAFVVVAESDGYEWVGPARHFKNAEDNPFGDDKPRLRSKRHPWEALST